MKYEVLYHITVHQSEKAPLNNDMISFIKSHFSASNITQCYLQRHHLLDYQNSLGDHSIPSEVTTKWYDSSQMSKALQAAKINYQKLDNSDQVSQIKIVTNLTL